MKHVSAICVVFLSLTLQAADRITPAAGPLKVVTAETVLHDSARNKDIRLKIYYPEARGPFPVIIFSHGAFGSKDAYWALGEYWASHGYVSIHPSHADSRKDAHFRGTLRDAISDPQAWQDRPLDISFVIDSLDQIEKIVPALRGRLDRSRIGVGGHSYGAYTAQAIAGATVTLPNSAKARSFADKRVKAVVIMSPQGEGEMGLTSKSWDGIRVPMFAMYGSRDFGTQRRTPDWRSQPFHSAPAGDKYDMRIEGATHMTFVGPFMRRRAESPLFQCAKVASLTFWDAYLKNDSDAKRALTAGAIGSFCNDAVDLQSK